MKFDEYPKEYFVEIGDTARLARLLIYKLEKDFSVELDIIFKESRKIERHIDILYKIESVEDAIHRGYEHLSKKIGKKITS